MPIPYKVCVNDVHFIARVQPYAASIHSCFSIGLQIHAKLDAKIQAIIDEHRAARTMMAGSRAPESQKKAMDFVDVLQELPGLDGEKHIDDITMKAVILVSAPYISIHQQLIHDSAAQSCIRVKMSSCH